MAVVPVLVCPARQSRIKRILTGIALLPAVGDVGVYIGHARPIGKRSDAVAPQHYIGSALAGEEGAQVKPLIAHVETKTKDQDGHVPAAYPLFVIVIYQPVSVEVLVFDVAGENLRPVPGNPGFYIVDFFLRLKQFFGYVPKSGYHICSASVHPFILWLRLVVIDDLVLIIGGVGAETHLHFSYLVIINHRAVNSFVFKLP